MAQQPPTYEEIIKEVDLIGEGLELTSGFLELTDVDFKAVNAIPYKQQLVLSALETQACIQNPDKPEDCYFFASTLKGKVTDSKGIDLKEGSIRKLLAELLEKKLAVKIEGVGYQSAEYHRLAPKFE